MLYRNTARDGGDMWWETRLATAGARRPSRPPPRFVGMRPLPCRRIGIHASAMVVVLMLCFENVRDVTGVVQADMSVRVRNASRRRKLNLHIAMGWLIKLLMRGG